MKKFYSIFAIAALMLAGCAEPDPVDPVTPDEEAQNKPAVYFTYGGVADMTRTAISPDKNANGATQFVWSEGDKVGVYCPYIGAANKQVTVSANPQTTPYYNAVLRTNLQYKDEADHTFYLYYPYSTASSSDPNTLHIQGQIPTLQDGDLRKSDFMWDIVTSNANQQVTDGVEGTMVHPHAYLRFFVIDASTKDANGGSITGKIAGKKVQAITIEGDGSAAVAGTFMADLASFKRNVASPAASNKVSFTSKSNSVTLGYPATPEGTSDAFWHVMNKEEYDNRASYSIDTHPVLVINPEGISGKSFKVYVTIEGMPTFTASVSGKTVQNGTFYNITLGALKQSDGNLSLEVVGWEKKFGEVVFE